MKKVLLTLSIGMLSISAFAQSGFLRGKVIDAENGEGLFGSTISLQGTTRGTSADFDGNYSLSLEEGTHTIEFRFFSYQTKTISDVEIIDGEVTLLDIELSVATTELAEIVITAEQAKDTEVALMTVQKKSTKLIDGISAQAFKKVGDGDLGIAMKRVTGVSVQGGKHVYVRGLGDRYTKTTVNGMSIPGLDPDKNSVQIDIFPTSTIENVIVYKTFSPDLQGDFTGGIVDVETKKFPDEKSTSVSLSLGFNPDMHLNNDYLTYDGGATDFLGFDDGNRALPFGKQDVIPSHITEGATAESFTRQFDPTLAAQTSTSFMDYGLSFSHGNQINKDKVTIGYNAIFNYQSKTEFYDNVQFGEYFKSDQSDVNELEAVGLRNGSLGNRDIMWNTLLSGALKFDRHSFSASLMRTQNGVSSASKRTSADLFFNPSITSDDILTYTQRAVTNAILVGKHGFDKFDLEWRAASAFSSISDPDLRDTRIENQDDGTFGLNTGVGAGVDRYYRDLNENNQSAKVDITVPFAETNKFRAGLLGTWKKRDYEILHYLFRNVGSQPISNDADELLNPDNIFTEESDRGTVVRGNFQPANTYEATQSIFAGYVMSEMQVLPKLKAIYGVRAEKTQMNYTGANQRGETFDDISTLDELNILPSVNLVYGITEEMNVRASFNQTLARPTFKEKSYAQIYDPITGRTFIGNIDLQQTNINNYDLRWEYFYGQGEMISLSGFYKTFDGHIELVSFPTAPDQLKPRNSGTSTVVGFEVEFKKNITDNLSFGTNASFIKSAVDMKSVIVDDQSGQTEYELRSENLRDGENLSDTRRMSGQSPFLINAYFNYTDSQGKYNASLAYNVQGETLNIVGSGGLPDIYTKPFQSLNLNVYKNLGPDLRSRITLGITNILNAERNNFYKSHQGNDPVFSLFRPGRSFNVKYSFSF